MHYGKIISYHILPLSGNNALMNRCATLVRLPKKDAFGTKLCFVFILLTNYYKYFKRIRLPNK